MKLCSSVQTSVTLVKQENFAFRPTKGCGNKTHFHTNLPHKKLGCYPHETVLFFTATFLWCMKARPEKTSSKQLSQFLSWSRKYKENRISFWRRGRRVVEGRSWGNFFSWLHCVLLWRRGFVCSWSIWNALILSRNLGCYPAQHCPYTMLPIHWHYLHSSIFWYLSI